MSAMGFSSLGAAAGDGGSADPKAGLEVQGSDEKRAGSFTERTGGGAAPPAVGGLKNKIDVVNQPAQDGNGGNGVVGNKDGSSSAEGANNPQQKPHSKDFMEFVQRFGKQDQYCHNKAFPCDESYRREVRRCRLTSG